MRSGKFNNYRTREQTSGVEIGSNVSVWRRARGISQADMARRCRVSVSTISKLERGDTSISVNTLLKVASVLGVRQNVEDAFNPSKHSQGAMLLASGVKERIRGG